MSEESTGAATRESLRLGPEFLVRSRRQDALLALRDAVSCHRRVIDTFGLLVDQDPEVDGASPDGMGCDGDDMAIAEALRVVETAHAGLLRVLCALEGKAAVAAMGLELSSSDAAPSEPGVPDADAAGCRTCGARPGREHDGAAHDAMILRGKPFFRRMMIAEDGERYLVRDDGRLVPTHAGEVQGTAAGPGLDPHGVALRHGALRELFVPGSLEPFGSPDAGTVFVLSELNGSTGAVALKRASFGSPNQLWTRDWAPGEGPSKARAASWQEINTVDLVSVVRVTP